VPRPRRAARAERLRLTHALVACDLNARYLELWPTVRRAWSELVGLEPVLVLVARPDEIPAALREDSDVIRLEPLPALHTAFQAQCVRLLSPALVETDGGVVVADVDMAPLSGRYFTRPASHVGADDFIAYRNVTVDLGEIPICYNAARPSTWSAVFGVRSLDDVRLRLEEWGRGVAYDGVHGGSGWTTDQRILYRTLCERGRRSRDVWLLDDDYTGFRRLERASLEKWGDLPSFARADLARGRYSDFHCLAADSPLCELNELVVDLATGRA
jgi:hypothetical protein